LRITARHGRQQHSGVGVKRLPVEIILVRQLNDAAQVHHGNPVRYMMNDIEVMGDKKIGQPEIFFQIAKQIQNLRLDGSIERGNRLVRDDQLRLQRQRPGDSDALPLSSAELVGIASGLFFAEANLLHQLKHFFFPLSSIGRPENCERLGNDALDGFPRVQRRIRILKNHLYAPPVRLYILRCQGNNIPASERNTPLVRLLQPDQKARHRGFAAPRLADEPQRFSLEDLKIDAVHRPNDPGLLPHKPAA